MRFGIEEVKKMNYENIIDKIRQEGKEATNKRKYDAEMWLQGWESACDKIERRLYEEVKNSNGK